MNVHLGAGLSLDSLTISIQHATHYQWKSDKSSPRALPSSVNSARVTGLTIARSRRTGEWVSTHTAVDCSLFFWNDFLCKSNLKSERERSFAQEFKIFEV